MPNHTRREILKGSLALAGLSIFALPEWALPALAEGETLVPFTDIPANVNFTPAPDRRNLDIRTIDGPFTPKDKFFTTQHYGHPEIDPAAFRLKISGLVDRPLSLSLDDLRKMKTTELIAGFECSGNRRPLQGLSSNGKWLSQIHAQEETYLGKYQARWYRTVRGEMIDGEMRWNETAVTHMQLKSFVARVTKDGDRYKVTGVILNDGTPIKSVEVKVDEGPWQAAALDSATNSKYSWKLFTYIWTGATPGEHTLVSRVTDATGKVQPTEKDLENKKSFLEDNSQHPRKVMIS